MEREGRRPTELTKSKRHPLHGLNMTAGLAGAPPSRDGFSSDGEIGEFYKLITLFKTEISIVQALRI